MPLNISMIYYVHILLKMYAATVILNLSFQLHLVMLQTSYNVHRCFTFRELVSIQASYYKRYIIVTISLTVN